MPAANNEPAPGNAWTAEEVALVVADYLDMLIAEMRGQRYSKAEHNRQLQAQLPARSRGAIEFKHANISAVLISTGLPYIRGYQPRRNFQQMLVGAVEQTLVARPELPELLVREARAPTIPPAVPDDPATLFQPLPDEIILPEPGDAPWWSRHGQKVNLAEREARNRKLGELGERFVLKLEQQRLRRVGRDDLARRVTWAAREWGDGLGFDVLSFHERTERERFIEVKTTNQGRHFPFYLTRTEARCSAAEPDHFQLYRVFDFRRDAGLYVVDGDVSRRLHLEPEVYRAATG